MPTDAFLLGNVDDLFKQQDAETDVSKREATPCYHPRAVLADRDREAKGHVVAVRA